MRHKGGMTKDERASYMKEYRKKYKKRQRSVNSVDLRGYIYVNLQPPIFIKNEYEYEKTKPIHESLIEIEDEYCIEYGCGRKLKLAEKLCGTKCSKHMVKEQSVFFNGLI